MIVYDYDNTKHMHFLVKEHGRCIGFLSDEGIGLCSFHCAFGMVLDRRGGRIKGCTKQAAYKFAKEYLAKVSPNILAEALA